MKKRIKLECLGMKVICPLTGKDIFVRFIDPELYNYYYNNGLDFLFEEDIKEVIEEEVFFNKIPNKKVKK